MTLRAALAGWLQALALRLEPDDPFDGLLDASVDRAFNGRWTVTVVFVSRMQAGNFTSYVLTRRK